MIAQIFNPNAELPIPTAIPTNEVNAEIETHLLTAETKTRKCSWQFKLFYVFHLLSHYAIFLVKYIYFFNLFFKSKVKVYVFFCHI